jgi:cytochrome P450
MNTSSSQKSAASQGDLFSVLGGGNAELLENPFPMFALMRSIGAIFPIPFPIAGLHRGAWVVTRMEEAAQVLKDHARFTVDASSIGLDGPFAHYTDSSFPARMMISVDDPGHRRLRGLVSKVFTPRYIESLRPRVRQIADELLDRTQARGEMDLVADYAFPPAHRCHLGDARRVTRRP